ncbi:MAG: ABC transporter ATP-binding protein [Sulfuritalea sp.]|nr:ABC transporter ATP-binding protein [Sulfuritalea sp.]
MLAIQIENLEKIYAEGVMRRPVKAVSGVSMEVPEGEAFGFVGPNGAGKSSTIRVLMGLARATRGSCKLFGIDAALPEARIRVGYVPENPCLYDYLTPLEIVSMSLRLHKCREGGGTRRQAMAWLERLGVADVASAPVRSFSKGMTQRVTLANAMAVNPRLLVLDEPLSGLDPIGRREVVDILADYKRGGGTLFFTSHVLHDVERLADRFGLIHKGELRSVRSPAELLGSEDLVMVRSSGSAAFPRAREESAGNWVAEVPRSELWVVLDQLRMLNHQLREVKPSLSLEAAFMHVVADEAPREDS